jgi:hypothetical protein
MAATLPRAQHLSERAVESLAVRQNLGGATMQQYYGTIKAGFILVMAAALLLFSSGSCSLYLLQNLEEASGSDTSGGDEQTGKLVVNINSTGVKTLTPPISMTPARYDVSGNDGNGGSFQENTAASSVTISNLSFGTWTVTVDALNDIGTIIGRGQKSVSVDSGQTSAVDVLVAELDGYGSLDLSLLWPAADTQNPSVQAVLTPSAGSTIDLSFTIPAPGSASCTQADIPKGYYTLELQLLDNGIMVAGAVEIVRIVKNQTPMGAFEFTEINAPGSGVAVDITPENYDPIEVTLSGQLDSIEVGSSMTVSASVPADTGTLGYTWYLNGQSKATGSTYTLGSDLAKGTYRLDVTAITADGSRAGSATHTFQVLAATVTKATLEWDPNSEPDLAGYKLHYGPASRSYDTVIDVGNQTTYTLTGLEVGETYYIAATAYNTSGLESGYSNEVIFDTSS